MNLRTALRGSTLWMGTRWAFGPATAAVDRGRAGSSQFLSSSTRLLCFLTKSSSASSSWMRTSGSIPRAGEEMKSASRRMRRWSARRRSGLTGENWRAAAPDARARRYRGRILCSQLVLNVAAG